MGKQLPLWFTSKNLYSSRLSVTCEFYSRSVLLKAEVSSLSAFSLLYF